MKKYKMSKAVLTLCIIIMYCMQANAQSAKEIVSSETLKITWLGMDFSKMKYIGVLPTSTGGGMYGGATSPFVLKDQVKNINEVFVAEMDKKYRLKEAISKKELGYNLKYAKQWNANLEREQVIEETSSNLGAQWTEEDLKKIVSRYQFENDVSGVGLIFVWERLNKTAEEGTVWVTFINTETKEIILTERMIGKPRGFGFKNYWLGATLEVIKEIDGRQYKKWKKKYGV